VLEIITPSYFEEWTEFLLTFENLDFPGSGWSFPCDALGRVFEDELAPAVKRILAACLSGINDGDRVSKAEVKSYTHSHHRPAIARCVCGQDIELSGFTNTCDKCGRDYNSSGQSLAPRSHWGEETEESPEDILRIK
jgi:hypothetical protein